MGGEEWGKWHRKEENKTPKSISNCRIIASQSQFYFAATLFSLRAGLTIDATIANKRGAPGAGGDKEGQQKEGQREEGRGKREEGERGRGISRHSEQRGQSPT